MTDPPKNRIRIALLLFLSIIATSLLTASPRNGSVSDTHLRNAALTVIHDREIALLKMSSDELFKIGITQVDQPGGILWSVAWSDSSDETCTAISDALEVHRIGAFASCGHGRAGWYVEREDFFRARQALLDSVAVKIRRVDIVTPKFKLQ